MSLIAINSVLKHTLQLLAKIEPSEGIELLSYKRNRTVSIIILPGDKVMIRERGYIDQTLTVSRNDVSKIVKAMIKREFPRSRKVRVFKLSNPDQIKRDRKTL